MKKYVLIFVLLLSLMTLPCAAQELTLRGCWVSTVYRLDYPSASSLSDEALAAEAAAIVERAHDDGFNALFLQVRPCADALYPSDYAPWSSWLSGTQDVAPDGSFDVLQCFLDLCHARGMQLHAWINPYRVTRQSADSFDDALAQLCADHPVRALREHLLLAGDGCLYLDPGQPECREYILDCAAELLERYAPDGLHLDDYFYPASDFDDSATVAAFADGRSDADFRRDSVTELVRSLHGLCRAHGAVFGISPFGIWANAHQVPGGSDTLGGSSYLDHCADSRRWVREELVDYVMPQLYWPIGNDEGEFSELLRWWSALTEGTNVRLYLGLGAYRSAEADPQSVWYGSAELERQLDLIEADPCAAGAVFFRYGSLRDTPDVEQAVAERMCAQRDLYRFPRSAFLQPLTLTSPTHSCRLLCGDTVVLSCTASPGSTVRAALFGQRITLRPTSVGEYGACCTIPEDSEEASALLLTCERRGMVFVKLFDLTMESILPPTQAVLTDVRVGDPDGHHEVDFCVRTAAQAEISGDVLTVTLWPVRTAAGFEDPWFTHVHAACADGCCAYALTLPGDGSRFDFTLIPEGDRVRLLVW